MRVAAVVVFFLLPLGLELACAGPDESRVRAATAERAWTWLTHAKQTLDARRAELARLEARPAGEAGSGAAAHLRREVQDSGEVFALRLVAFINADPPRPGEPLTPRQLAALRMKTAEDILVARQFLGRAGDRRRALEILRGDLAVDPENPKLRQEILRTEADRYMRQERFAGLAKGMTQEEVRRLLGQPNLNNTRVYPERGVIAWFYPKDPSGAACGVWFDSHAAPPAVYSFDWNAVPGRPAQF